MSYRIGGTGNEWTWGDENGRSAIENHGLPEGYENPHDLLADLRRQTNEAGARKGPLTPAEHATAARYSSLAAALDLLCNPFRHVHDSAPGGWCAPEAVPECCGQPMHLRPSGWHCRERCGAVLWFG